MAMTRKQMEAVIKNGGSVMLGDNRIVTKMEDLPGEEDLATTDEEKAAVAADLRGQMDQLSVRLAKVEDRAPNTASAPSGVNVEALQASVRDAIARAARAEGERDVLGTQVATLAEQRDSLLGQVHSLQRQIEDYSAPNNSEASAPQSSPLPPAPSLTGEGGLEAKATPLPADFPKRDQLLAVGIDTVEAVVAKSVDELNAVEGITSKTAGAVKEAAVAALAQTALSSPF